MITPDREQEFNVILNPQLVNPQNSRRCDELQYVIKKLTKEATKLKALNAVQFSHNLVRSYNKVIKEENATRGSRQVDIKLKVKEIQKYLRRQKNLKNQRAKRGEDDSEENDQAPGNKRRKKGGNGNSLRALSTATRTNI